MKLPTAVGIGALLTCAGLVARQLVQPPPVREVDETVLREYSGAYQWEQGGFVYLHPWGEFGERTLLGAFDESGELRALYPQERDRFFAGPGAATPTSIESRIDFQRDAAGLVTALTWRREDTSRVARRASTETHEDVRFSNGDVRLAGTLIKPAAGGPHPAVILVHGSGPASREQILPFARFLVRDGFAILCYDKRGVGASTGDWNAASFADLAGDVAAAFEYLKTRSDVDARQTGMLGVSQAGWIMPLAAVRAKDLAFLISVSGAAIPPAETSLDHARHEMTAGGMKPQTVAEIIEVMRLQHAYARTGHGWEQYATALERLAARLGRPPGNFPTSREHPSWEFMRRIYFHDPAPVLRQLVVPTLAIFGELDNNILPEKNKQAWESALQASGNRDYTLRVLPKANHMQLEARVGTNAEMASLQRFVPEYFTTVREWLAARIRGGRD